MSAETLLDIFVPPEGMVGHSAALIAMTGAEDFLDGAMTRFTGLAKTQRSQLGIINAFLMLDGHSSSSRKAVFPPGRIPGLHEFQPRAVDAGSLLHAKVALLAFAPNRTGAPIHLRLAVLTANFTYASARQQLELVWLVDLPLDGTARPADRADIVAAGAFVETLLARRFHRDEQSLAPKERKLTARLDVLLTAASSLATNRKPRFIHSLDRPLYDQIKERFQTAWKKSPRNLLLCGSGFYERPSKNGAKPGVLAKLEELGVFSGNVRRVAIVEPSEAGAMASWCGDGKAEKKDGWEICQCVDALDLKRKLHAKFIYVGYLRDGHMSNGSLYLGSGNLSKRGLLSGENNPLAEKVDGKDEKVWNVESGVVFAVGDRFAVKNQYDRKGEFSEDAIARRLFWLDGKNADLSWDVGSVGDAPEDEVLIEAPPILSAILEVGSPRKIRFIWRDEAKTQAEISLSEDGPWSDAQRGLDVSKGDVPSALHVRVDAKSHQWKVPIVDAAGRIGWLPPRFDTYADAIAALLDFPIRPAEATDDDDRDEEVDGGAKGPGAGGSIEQEKTYALHAAAELVEKVAALQAALPEAMLDDWLDHLDRMFRASFPETLIATWRAHRLDVFAHLREPELRSPHLTDKQRARYFEVLDGAARAWGLR